MLSSEHACSQKRGHSLNDRLLIRIFRRFIEIRRKGIFYVNTDTGFKVTILIIIFLWFIEIAYVNADIVFKIIIFIS